MIINTKALRNLFTSAAVISVAASLPAFAQPLDLSDQPIFLGGDAPANVLFLIDDSGSMDWEIVTGDAEFGGTLASNQPNGRNLPDAGEVKHRDDNDDGTADCTFTDGTRFGGTPSYYGYFYGVEFASNIYNDDNTDCNTADDEAWRFRNADFNSLYYNPAQTYSPWAGVDANGNEFTDIDPTNAPDDPFEPRFRIDLTRHNSDNLETNNNQRSSRDRDGDGQADGLRYYTWEDLDDDGNFDNGEETEIRVQDLPATPSAYTDTNGDGEVGSGDTLSITTAGNTVSLPYPASQQQFANWFSYYRSRALSAKNAYGKLIFNARNVRMGLITINNNNNANTQIRDMDQAANKAFLLRQLYDDFAPSGGTPLRSAMNACGAYLSCNGNPFGFNDSCPRLAASSGGSCQQNFLVTMTDGYYNGNLGNIGNTDGDDNTPWDGGAYADGFSNTLADIAMRYYENDIHPSLPDELNTIPGVDEARHQHVVTYTVAFGVNGTLEASPTDNQQSFPWTNPGAGNAEKIDDLRHAAYNGRGLFLDSRDPTNLADSLQSALSDIGDRTSSAAAVALNSGSLNINTGVFQARFDSGDWSGELLFFPVSDGTGNTPGCGNEAQGELCQKRYDAGRLLNDRNWDLQRTILSYAADSRTGVPFRWNSISESQRDQISNNPFGSDFSDEVGALILAYLRGDRRLEPNSVVRDRSSVLGDIVNSDPFFVGGPVQNYDFDNYASFKAANRNRTPVAYVGANDGMLHAFNANTGQELFAYVPNAVYKDLNRLLFANYNRNHRYYVDGPPVVGDAFINSQWRSVLVSGLRGGGQAVFALDVTNPTGVTEGNAANTVMWEFTDADDPNLGYTYSQPTITRMANGRWAAIVSSGYNNTEADGNASDTGRGYIFVLYLEGPGSDGVWNLGSDYQRIALPAASGSISTPAGIATPAAVSIDDDVDAEFIYVGDLNGNMWRVDVGDASANAWSVSFTGNPLFVARDDTGTPQPITVRPEVGAHPTGLDNGLVVYFGTGQFLQESDNNPNNAQTMSLYGIWDENTAGLSPAISRADLLEQQILQEFSVQTDNNNNRAVACRAGDDCFRATTDNDIDYISQNGGGGGHRGWFMDLKVANSNNNRGERQVSTPILREGRLFFTTLLPSEGACEFGGDSFLMILDPENGGRLDFSPFDVDNNNSINDGDFVQLDNNTRIFVTGRKSKVGIVPRPAILAVPAATEEYLFTSGSEGSKESIQTESGGRLGRILWRQIQ